MVTQTLKSNKELANSSYSLIPYGTMREMLYLIQCPSRVTRICLMMLPRIGLLLIMMMVITNFFLDLTLMLLKQLKQLQMANSLKIQTLKVKVNHQLEVITYLILWEWVRLITQIRSSRQVWWTSLEEVTLKTTWMTYLVVACPWHRARINHKLSAMTSWVWDPWEVECHNQLIIIWVVVWTSLEEAWEPNNPQCSHKCSSHQMICLEAPTIS